MRRANKLKQIDNLSFMMKVNVTKSLSYFIDFVSINGFYVIIMIFTILNPNIESRLYTIPARLLVVLSMILLITLNHYKPCQDKLVYLFLSWFFIFYWFKIIIEIIYGNNHTYIPAYEYLLYSVIYCFFPFVYFSQRRSENSFDQIFNAILVSGIIFSTIIIILFFKTQKSGIFDRFLIGISPLIVSYVGSLLTGICLSRLVFNKSYGHTRLLIIGLLIGICPLIIGGSRGPILALIVPFVIAFVYKIGKLFSTKFIKYAIFVAIILFIALGIFGNVAFARFGNIFKDIAGKTVDASRMIIWNTAFKQFLSSPVWGDSIQIKGFQYPHNLTLEVLMSTGIIGYFPFLIMMGFGIYKSFRILKYYPSYIWLYVFFIQTLIMGMLSGTVYSDIWYWSSLAMIFAVDLRNKESSTSRINTSFVNE